MSTANAVGVALSSAYGILLGVLLVAHVRGRTWTVVATAGACILGIYWSLGRHIFS